MRKRLIILFLIITLIIVGVFIIVNKDSKNNKKSYELDFKDRIESINEFETTAFKDGWIQVQGTNIDLPVVYHKELINESEVTYHYAFLGDLPNGDEYTRKAIGSHNVINVSNKPVTDMTNLQDFEGLMAFVYYDFAKENLYIKYTSYKGQKEYLYKIYAIGFYDYETRTFSEKQKSNKEGINLYINNAKENSIYKYDVDVNENDELLMLYTCTRFFGLNEKQQIFIDARRVRKNEKIDKYNVEKTKLFDELGMYD